MSNAAPPSRRIIEVEAGVLPPPATRLVITQHLRASDDPPFWAWIIVGAFFDAEENIVWSTEIFAGHLDIELESDEESDSDSVESSDSETQSSSVWDTNGWDSESAIRSSHPHLHPHLHPRHSDLNSSTSYYQRQWAVQQNLDPPPAGASILPPSSWDPTRQGPVPGYWQAAFNPVLRRWVHTWQPLY